jgi:hypothetical protein
MDSRTDIREAQADSQSDARAITRAIADAEADAQAYYESDPFEFGGRDGTGHTR